MKVAYYQSNSNPCTTCPPSFNHNHTVCSSCTAVNRDKDRELRHIEAQALEASYQDFCASRGC